MGLSERYLPAKVCLYSKTRSVLTSLFPGNPYFCAVGLDRFLRVWKIGAGGKKPLHKIYLKSRLNCVAMSQHFDPDKILEEEENEPKEDTLAESGDDSIEILGDEEEGKDDVWDEMVVINSSKRKKDEQLSKRKKIK